MRKYLGQPNLSISYHANLILMKNKHVIERRRQQQPRNIYDHIFSVLSYHICLDRILLEFSFFAYLYICFFM